MAEPKTFLVKPADTTPEKPTAKPGTRESFQQAASTKGKNIDAPLPTPVPGTRDALRNAMAGSPKEAAWATGGAESLPKTSTEQLEAEGKIRSGELVHTPSGIFVPAEKAPEAPVVEPKVAEADEPPKGTPVPPGPSGYKASAPTGNFPGDPGYEEMRAKQWAPEEKGGMLRGAGDGLGKALGWLAKTAPGVLKGALTMIGDYNAGRGGYPELTSTAREQAQLLQQRELENALALKGQDVALAKYLQAQEPTIAGQTAQAVVNPQLAYQRGMLNLQYSPDSPYMKYLMGQAGPGQMLAQQYLSDPQAALAAYLNGQVALPAQQTWALPNSAAQGKASALPVTPMRTK